MFPNMDVQLFLIVSSPPRLSISPNGVTLNAALDIEASAIRPNSSLASLFLLGLVSYSLGAGQRGVPIVLGVGGQGESCPAGSLASVAPESEVRAAVPTCF